MTANRMNKLFIVILLSLLFSCAKDADPALDKANFTRIYDNNKFNGSYFPIDVKQTPDGGYLILAERRLVNSSFNGTYLLKVDELGAFVSELEVPSNQVAPIGPLLEANSKYYFFSMEPGNFQTQLSEVEPTGTVTKTTLVGGSYPSAAYKDNSDSNFVLLRYDNTTKQSVVTVMNPNGSVSKSMGFTIGAGDGVEEKFISHFLRTGRQFPFQVGKTANGQYFFNGFYNYNFSLVFSSLSTSNPTGIAFGQQDQGGFSCVFPLEGNNYAAARFNFGDNYLLPTTNINSTGISQIVDLAGNNLLELSSNATVKVINLSLNTKSILLFASNTRSKQIALFGYDRTTGKLVGSKYLGFSNTYEIASLTSTSDGGLAVCGTTYVAGRFPRICLFKISKEELGKSFK
jgi:hypothetical protein